MKNVTKFIKLTAGALLVAGMMSQTVQADDENICSTAGLLDASWGLCNAFCEAKDCDSPENADSKSCGSILKNFQKHAGEGAMPPCSAPTPPPPPRGR